MLYFFLNSNRIERYNKYNKTITANIADGIAASFPNKVIAVTTENPELFIVSNNTCVMLRSYLIPAFLEKNSNNEPIPKVADKSTIEDNIKIIGSE
ncbi:MAG: hypothetical protein KAQ75_01515, partial [Bacteroidales bacterium]|nr:hypothetical protein [Bacteroidales bacterium]